MLGRPKLVLASGSPRRLALVNQAGIEPDALRPADVDETPIKGELPRACANRLARAKAETALATVRVDEELRGSFVLATTVSAGASCPRPSCSTRPRNACACSPGAIIASTRRCAW